jgi:hypothetical protein
MVSFTPLRLYGLGKSLWPHRWSRGFAEENNLLPRPGIEPQFLGSPSRSQVTTPITLSVQLHALAVVVIIVVVVMMVVLVVIDCGFAALLATISNVFSVNRPQEN